MLERAQVRRKRHDLRARTVSCSRSPTRAEHSSLAGIMRDAGKGCVGMRRVRFFTCCGSRFGAALEHTAQPTDGSASGMEEEMRGNLWEHSDEWLLRRAHAPAWAAPLIRISGSPEAARGEVATTCAQRSVQDCLRTPGIYKCLAPPSTISK